MNSPARPRVNQAQQWLAYPSVPGGSGFHTPTVAIDKWVDNINTIDSKNRSSKISMIILVVLGKISEESTNVMNGENTSHKKYNHK